MTFEAVDPDRFPCFNIARQALETGGVAPAVLNAANEVAVDAFLQGKVGFDGIASIVEATLAKELDGDSTTIEAIFSIDQRARQQAHHLVAKGNIFKNG